MLSKVDDGSAEWGPLVRLAAPEPNCNFKGRGLSNGDDDSDAAFRCHYDTTLGKVLVSVPKVLADFPMPLRHHPGQGARQRSKGTSRFQSLGIGFYLCPIVVVISIIMKHNKEWALAASACHQ